MGCVLGAWHRHGRNGVPRMRCSGLNPGLDSQDGECPLSVILAFALVLTFVQGGEEIGRTVVFGFENMDQCEAQRLKLASSDTRGVCLADDKVNEYMQVRH